MAGKLLRCKNGIRSEIEVHEPSERLMQAKEEGLDPDVQRPIIKGSNTGDIQGSN